MFHESRWESGLKQCGKHVFRFTHLMTVLAPCIFLLVLTILTNKHHGPVPMIWIFSSEIQGWIYLLIAIGTVPWSPNFTYSYLALQNDWWVSYFAYISLVWKTLRQRFTAERRKRFLRSLDSESYSRIIFPDGVNQPSFIGLFALGVSAENSSSGDSCGYLFLSNWSESP